MAKVTATSDNPMQWQTTKSNVRDRNEHMYLNQLISDIKFTVGKKNGEELTVPAHKYVLSTASPVFFAMVYGEFAKSDNIEIEDCETEPFLELLRFIYCDQVNLNAQNVVDVLYLANKYIMPVLSKECIKYLLDNVQSENVLDVLNAAMWFGENRLEKHCWSILSRKTSEILKTEAFGDIDRNLLINILKKDTLNVQEIHIFQAVKKWAEKECLRQSLEVTSENQKIVLKGIINLIRFPVMSAKEFALDPARSDILNLEDVKNIFIYLNSGLAVPQLKYPMKPRVFKPHVCSRYLKPMKNYLWRYDEKDIDAIRFKVDQEVFLAGIGLYGSPCGGEYTVTVDICLENQNLHKHSSSFTCPPGPEFNAVDNPLIHNIMFDEPLRIQEDLFHEVFVLLDGPPSFAGDDGRLDVTEEGVNFVFENSSGSTNGTNYDEGQIPTLLFYF